VAVSDLRALHWTVSGGELRGFRDPAWQPLQSGKVTLGERPEADAVRLGPGESFGHPRVSVTGGIELAVEAEDGWGGVELSLFAAEMEGPNKEAFVLNVFFSGDQVYAQAKGHQRGQTSGQSVRESGDSVLVKVWRERDVIKVSSNGTPLLSAVIDPSKTQGEGLILRAGSMWGNNVRPVKVTRFRATPQTGELPVLNASATAKAEALSIPRFRREILPKHLLVAHNGDVVRGRIETITADSLRFTSGIETLEVPRSRVRAIVWPQLPDAKPTVPKTGDGLWLTLHDGSAFALNITEFGETEVTGQSAVLGPFRVPLRSIATVAWSVAEVGPAVKSHLEWPMNYAPEPVLPDKEASPMLGKVAPSFILPLLYESDFKLEAKKGQVVVLDFWASWCGPCVQTIPDLLELAQEYGENEVYFLAINQSEPATLVKRFIETRGWKLNVALDGLGGTGLKYGVEGIPHTVVIDAEGNVAAVFVGASPDGKIKLKAAIEAAKAKRHKP
jgi:thiol-disulfide isomerase/thioredoxin